MTDSNFRTKIAIPPASNPIRYEDTLVCIGSCFAQNIGEQLQKLKYTVAVNPFGALYNPLSIRNGLALLLNDYVFTEQDLFQHQGLWHSFQHHGSFSGIDRDQVLLNIQRALVQSREYMESADCLLLTLGTSWVYELKENGVAVANCHKMADSYFVRRRMTVDEIKQTLYPLFSYLLRRNSNLQIILSVSPIRHLKDGFTGNALSKASLLLAANALAEEHQNVHYFPAFEIMMDDLRDYRFYDEDMTHPSAQAIDYIWNAFENTFLEEGDTSMRAKLHKLWKSVNHRPLHPGSEQHRQHIDNVLKSIRDLEKTNPSLDFTDEKDILNAQLQV